MSEGELFCNARHCHKVLNSIAWVTFCSHIFCEEDGTSQLGQVPCVCPACGAQLASKGDIIRVDLDPSEQFRNMILAGFKPEIVLDICSRAMNFWTYQMEKERQRQVKRVEQIKSQMTELEEFYEKILRDTNAELLTMNRQLDSARKERDETLVLKDNMSAKLGEKSRQYLKLKNLYDSLRRRSNVASETFETNLSGGGSRSAPAQSSLVPYLQNPQLSQPFPRSEGAQFLPKSPSTNYNLYDQRATITQNPNSMHLISMQPNNQFRSSYPGPSGSMDHQGSQHNMQQAPLRPNIQVDHSQNIAAPRPVPHQPYPHGSYEMRNPEGRVPVIQNDNTGSLVYQGSQHNMPLAPSRPNVQVDPSQNITMPPPCAFLAPRPPVSRQPYNYSNYEIRKPEGHAPLSQSTSSGSTVHQGVQHNIQTAIARPNIQVDSAQNSSVSQLVPRQSYPQNSFDFRKPEDHVPVSQSNNADFNFQPKTRSTSK